MISISKLHMPDWFHFWEMSAFVKRYDRPSCAIYSILIPSQKALHVSPVFIGPSLPLSLLHRAVTSEIHRNHLLHSTVMQKIYLFIVLITAWFATQLLNKSVDVAGALNSEGHLNNSVCVFGKCLFQNSMKVMFKCLWKNCEKVLSTSSGIQRHIRTIHLGLVASQN